MGDDPTPAETLGDAPDALVARLAAASDEELEAIMAAAGRTDLGWRGPRRFAPVPRRSEAGTVEIVLLGALGCRHG